MKLFLIVAAAFAFVVCQVQARDSRTNDSGNSNKLRTSIGSSKTSTLKEKLQRLHQINRRKPGTIDTSPITRFRIEIGKTIITKIKQLTEGAVALLGMLKTLTEKIEWTILSQLIDSLINALNQFTVNIDPSEESEPDEIEPSPEDESPPETPPETPPEGPEEEEKQEEPEILRPLPLPILIPVPQEPSPNSTSKPSRMIPFRPYSRRCHKNDPRLRCRRGIEADEDPK